jgi:hypothetical protein
MSGRIWKKMRDGSQNGAAPYGGVSDKDLSQMAFPGGQKPQT